MAQTKMVSRDFDMAPPDLRKGDRLSLGKSKSARIEFVDERDDETYLIWCVGYTLPFWAEESDTLQIIRQVEI